MSLTHEIKKVYAHHVQTLSEYQTKKDIVGSFLTKLNKAFRYDFRHIDVFIVGSAENGFTLKESDIDLAVILQNSAFVTRDAPRDNKEVAQKFTKQSKKLLNRICNETQKSKKESAGIFWDCRVDAKVPILIGDGVHYGGGCVSVDLHIDNTNSIRNTHLMKCYSKIDDRVAPLVVAVKVWAKNNKIYKSPSSPKDTLSSYSIALMVIHYLQCGVEPAVVPCFREELPTWFKEGVDLGELRKDPKVNTKWSDNDSDLGSLFEGFFDYYSCFDFENDAISVRIGGDGLLSATSLRQSNYDKWRFLCIEEPFTRSNVAKSVQSQYFFNHIKQKIQDTDSKLSRGCGFHSLK